jgi:hypothetical protein
VQDAQNGGIAPPFCMPRRASREKHYASHCRIIDAVTLPTSKKADAFLLHRIFNAEQVSSLYGMRRKSQGKIRLSGRAFLAGI